MTLKHESETELGITIRLCQSNVICLDLSGGQIAVYLFYSMELW